MSVRRPIDPEPVSVRHMTPWMALVDGLEQLPIGRLRELADQLVEDLTSSYGALGRKLKRDFAFAHDDELPEVIIHAALKIGALIAHVSFPPSNNCYRIEPYYWDLPLDDGEAVAAIERGVAPPALSQFDDQTLEHDLANRPLLVEVSDRNSLLKS